MRRRRSERRDDNNKRRERDGLNILFASACPEASGVSDSYFYDFQTNEILK